MYTYRIRYRIQTIFCKLICVLRIAGNNLTQLERKMIGGINANELADTDRVYPVYISRQGKPFLSGMRISLGHVLTVATYIDEIDDCTENYKVHYKNANDPGEHLTEINVEGAIKHPDYVSGQELSPYNVGIVQVSFSIHNQHFQSTLQIEVLPILITKKLQLL